MVDNVVAQPVAEVDAQTLPHWDMETVFPGLDSPEFQAAMASAVVAVGELETLFDREGVEKQEPVAALTPATIKLFETVLQRINATMKEINLLVAYVNSFTTTDSRNDRAQALWSQIQLIGVRLAKLNTRMIAWVGSLPVEEMIAGSTLAADHAFALRKAKRDAQHLMSPREEELAAELGLTGGGGWAKLYNTYTSQILVPFEFRGRQMKLPMSSLRNLAHHPDRTVRRNAYVAELAAWEGASVPIAAALNSIKGEVNTLAQRRGWESPLATALVQNNIDRPTLDAVLQAAREAFPDMRRYLRTKARLLGLERLAWYDLFAPIGESRRTWRYDEAAEFIIEQFGTFSERMRDLAVRAFDENWIDAEPRPGKRDGAFCMALREDESRILTNFKENFNSVSTLAHELGHAYHNLNLAPRTATQKVTPMTLSETASIFCETVVTSAALAQANDTEKLGILEASLQSACQVVLDIASRFLFEQSLFAYRRQRELSVDELCDLMLATQRESYGDGLDETQLHPYMWAAKPHYYSAARSFYNYPYLFGLLFALGLYARYQETPDAFRRNYDELLSCTGMADVAELAGRFGIDIGSIGFWRGSLDVIRDEVDQFERLATA